MSDLEKEIINNLNEVANWRIPILFGALKRYRYYFWTYSERRILNDEYHKDLEDYNGFPIRKLNIFRKKSNEKIEVNSFFEDLGKQGEYLRHYISDIKHNLFHLNEIIKMSSKQIKKRNSLGVETMVYTDAMVFYKEVEEYISKELKEKRIERLPYEIDQQEVFPGKLVINHNQADIIIKEYNRERTTIKVEYDEDWNEVDYTIVWCGYPITYKEKNEITLSDKAKEVLNSQLTKIKDIDLKTCLELVNSYKLFVFEKDYKKFEKSVKDLYLITNTLFEWIPVEKIVELLRQFYSYSVYFGTKEELRNHEFKEVVSKVTEDLFLRFYEAEGLFWLVDLLGYCCKKGFTFLCTSTYRDLNSVMRKVVPYSEADWYCFDPEVKFNWLDPKTMEMKKTVVYGWNFDLVVFNLVNEGIAITSSLLVDVLDIAYQTRSYSEATSKIDQAIKEYKKNLKKGLINF